MHDVNKFWGMTGNMQ